LRSDVKYPDLRRHVREQRGVLLSAALTILRAWVVAGKPRYKDAGGKGLTPWGSFEGWSSVVREAVVFAGLSDPGETRLALQTMADRDALAMVAMIDALERVDHARQGRTTAEIIDAIRNPPKSIPAWHADLKSAVEELCGKLDGRALGYRFRHFARRNFGGKMIDRARSGHGGVIRWVVCPAAASASIPAPAGTSPPSPPSPPDGNPAGGDGGDGGDVLAQAGNGPDDDYDDRFERECIQGEDLET
jgi:hypothetical protein